MKDWQIVSLITVVVFSICALVLALAALGDRRGCEARAELMGVPAHYGFNMGCMVQLKGRWVPMPRYVVQQ